MSQSNTGQAQAAETLTQETKTFIRQVRTKTRRKYAPEDKIRIVLEGFRREVTVSDKPVFGRGLRGTGSPLNCSEGFPQEMVSSAPNRDGDAVACER